MSPLLHPVSWATRPPRRLLVLAVLLALCLALGTARTASADAPADGSFPALIPQPVEVTPQDGAPFALTASTRIIASGTGTDAAELLAGELRIATELPLPIRPHAGGASSIVIDVREGGAPDGHETEGYRLTVSERSIHVEASTREGAISGVRTLQQLFGSWATSDSAIAAPALSAPAVTITDYPRFDYRGFGLDVTRSFYDVEEVQQVIDRASRVKLNVLHLHLSDDQGWRIAIDGGSDTTTGIDYSRLTDISGKTAMTYDDDGELMGTELGRSGFYTKADYADIIEYATAHGVTVVPEIDVPGHTNAALHAIPELNSAGSLPQPEGGEDVPPADGTPHVGYSSLDVDNPASAVFVETVMRELAEMTPGPYLHMGGDESHSTPTEDYRSMVGTFAAEVAETGKTVIGWNEFAAATLPANAVVQYWNGDAQQTADDVLRNDARVILSPASRAYAPQKAASDQEQGATWACGGPCTIEDWYDWDPATQLPGVGEKRVLGVEAIHWGEWMRGLDQVDSFAWPRALATAELGWTPQSERHLGDFLERVEAYSPALQLAGMTPHPIPEIEADALLAASSERTGDGFEVTVRAAAPSADPAGLTARFVDRSGRRTEIPLTAQKDLTAPMVVSSALTGERTIPAGPYRGSRVELLSEGAVIAEADVAR